MSRFWKKAIAILLMGVSAGCGNSQDEPNPVTVMGVSYGASAVAPAENMKTMWVACQVTLVDDPLDALGGLVRPGDGISGCVVYDETRPDEKKPANDGKYTFDEAPNRFDFDCNGLKFASDPASVDMEMRIRNRTPDSYWVNSKDNLDVLPGVGTREIRITLEDDSGTAVASDTLLGLLFRLEDWPTSAEMTISGDDGWQITAQVVSIPDDMFEESEAGTRKMHFRSDP